MHTCISFRFNSVLPRPPSHTAPYKYIAGTVFVRFLIPTVARSYSWNPTKMFPLFVFILQCTHAGGIDLFFTEHAVRAITFFFSQRRPHVDSATPFRVTSRCLLCNYCYCWRYSVNRSIFRSISPGFLFATKPPTEWKFWAKVGTADACCAPRSSPGENRVCRDYNIVLQIDFRPGRTGVYANTICIVYTVRLAGPVRVRPFDVRACLKCKHGTRDLKRKRAYVRVFIYVFCARVTCKRGF